jgi:hypothetical protein
MPIRSARLFAAFIMLSACTVERTPHLYPTNNAADMTGVLEGHIIGHGNLHGTMDVSMPDGERLAGEYSIVPEGSVSIGFGSVFTTVYGSHAAASGGGTTRAFAFPAGGQGVASLFGSKGTTLECEFLNSNMTGHGYGACRSSGGGVYRMMY